MALALRDMIFLRVLWCYLDKSNQQKVFACHEFCGEVAVGDLVTSGPQHDVTFADGSGS
ncbi:hypothetical protein [Xylella fastidiosa]|uniref:Uncharacterized protein n=1 Tax=Xylella fastidiosa (strain 9a5c) TaxID=160492 RepID=Q9PA36_XYLFA|nr:hypothetical protein [Xylella fastidiosa]AAF85481.1 hypothetical protein XF_2684 [Xylella fastidiosa 9a5c]ETE28955.1 hypothetical protein B398_12135 [Xylella fastidiosa 32]WGZ34277.1 hypothetical protein O4445_11730 [Xylella fastidiosa subsp. pauca]WGZ36568.1 hypothetical protein O4443_11555 [Xylella fastidiosa subsp. pauca]